MKPSRGGYRDDPNFNTHLFDDAVQSVRGRRIPDRPAPMMKLKSRTNTTGSVRSVVIVPRSDRPLSN